MLIPLSWLRDYVDIDADVDVDRLAHDLTMSGTKIESIEQSIPEFTGVVVGKVLDRWKHPNADRLSVCKVSVLDEEFEIVCGASNVRAGLTVAVARVGAVLPGDFKIRKSKIRGQVSFGMICSARELGLGDEHDGILELQEDLEQGADFSKVMDKGEVILEPEITPNRPDCLGLVGIAREVAALYEKPVRYPELWQGKPSKPAAVEIEIEDAADCGRYFGRVLRNVKVGPSPDWLQARLRSMGAEPINNVVDITNYVLFETGQPVHAFDFAKVKSSKIIVRRAKPGERIRTLDGEDRKLDPSILVIADASNPVAIAGVMGGQESAVQQETRDLLLEVAFFKADLVRSGRRQLGIDTDASYRFERQADLDAARWVADRATKLLVNLCGAEVVEQELDVYPHPYKSFDVSLRMQRANALIGTELSASQAASLLSRLELPSKVDQDNVIVAVPSFRRDLKEEIDLVEELARVYGYENIPDDVIPAAPLNPMPNELDEFISRMRHKLVQRGFFEIRTSAFMDRQDPDRLHLVADDLRRKFVAVRNPLMATLNTMRTSMIPGALRVLRHNQNHGQTNLRLVLLDRTFINQEGEHPGLPSQKESIVGLICGRAQLPHWSEAGRDYDGFDLKGELTSLLDDLDVDTVWTYGYTEPFLESATSFLISGTYGDIGRGGELSAAVLQAYDVSDRVFYFELDIASLMQHLQNRKPYQGVPKFPAVKRDLSLVVPPSVTYEQLRQVVSDSSGKYLESVQCFDVFEDEALAEGSRSVGIHLRFRAPERTLSDDAVEPAIQTILRKLEKSLQVQLRAG